MRRQAYTWGRSSSQLRQEERWLESLCVVGLLVAALILYCTNLGSLPLRDWDEGTVAQIAKEIWQAPRGSSTWLFPTLWGEPYFNKPPLLHNAIALCYALIGVNEWSARLPGAVLSACSVPLLYSVGRAIFVARMPAMFAALVYLTFLPVVRQGRLAMLDGAVLCFSLLAIWCVLRARRDLRACLGAGLAFSLIGLTKGAIVLLIGVIAVAFLLWDTPRLFRSVYFWGGLLLGSIPVVSWYSAQWQRYQTAFIDQHFLEQSLQRVYAVVEGNSGPPWYYLGELMKYSWPWLIFSVWGLGFAWRYRNWGWAKLVLLWSGIYFAAVTFMPTKLPWYLLPIYPALALAAGVQLAEICRLPSYAAYPKAWRVLFQILALCCSVGNLYLAWATGDFYLVVVLSALTLTLWVATILLMRRDLQFIPVLFWGVYISLLLFVSTPHWNWELNEAYPVRHVADLIRLRVPATEIVYTSFDYERPSLNFYSEHQVIPAADSQLQILWKQKLPYLLLDTETLERFQNQQLLKSFRIIGTAEPHWVLVTKADESLIAQ
ncbi:MAG: ArnT family glycosyltransferase [Cyanophyceae cyanobacterium]